MFLELYSGLNIECNVQNAGSGLSHKNNGVSLGNSAQAYFKSRFSFEEWVVALLFRSASVFAHKANPGYRGTGEIHAQGTMPAASCLAHIT